jgi:hypothetical protein
MSPSEHLGRRAIFVEAGAMCLATVVSVAHTAEWFTAGFEVCRSPQLSCQLRLGRAVGESRVESWSEAAVFGERWEVGVGPGQFWPEDDYWQATFLWGGGFRVFFKPTLIERFTQRDVSWLDEIFDPDEASLEEEETEDDALPLSDGGSP